MIFFKKLSLLILIFIYIVSVLILHLIFIFTHPRWRYRIISNCTKRISIFFRRILRIKVFIEGRTSYLKDRGNFIISNHLSYLDGIVLGSLFPVVFVSKLQVKSWPIFGLMTQVSGTIFIDRKNKLKSKDAVGEIADMLKNKINVLLFPEGTSTDGSKTLPFQSIFFQAPLNSGASIIPVTIKYTKVNSQSVTSSNRDIVCWYGQIKFLPHLLNILKIKSIEAKVIIHPKIEIDSLYFWDGFRKQLSEMTRQVILEDYSFIK